ncbi:MAG: YdcF family protein [Lachnospiraceae bacterium]|nr:YdcF family protein [Lachnospiraceae bacterium]
MAIRIILYLVSLISLWYSYVIYNVHSGSRFYLFWDVLAICLTAVALMLKFRVFSRIPRAITITVGSVVGLGLVISLVMLVLIFSTFNAKPGENTDYIIVLGAQMRSDGPSVVLRYRLDAAAEYLKEHPDVKCVCSGGKGANEPESEASGMARYLLGAGIDRERIILEEKSTNTRENIKYSRELIPEGSNICIVTNNFHMYRALFLSRNLGLENPRGLSAPSLPLYAPNNVVREVIGLVKDMLLRKDYVK